MCSMLEFRDILWKSIVEVLWMLQFTDVQTDDMKSLSWNLNFYKCQF